MREREKQEHGDSETAESVCSQSWSIAVEGGAMPFGIGEGC